MRLDLTTLVGLVGLEPTTPALSIDSLARLLEEQGANVLGINVLWFRTYEEMPALMASISGAQ
jgi:hypothetical protein